jgi:pyridoxamine 5'-phosphate oxidase
MSEHLHDPQIAALRRDYMQRGLSEKDLDPDPFRQFAAWFDDALQSKVILEPNAMVLSTVSPEGSPRGRFVLLKGFNQEGFYFFTNYRSLKGQHLETNPRASLTFGWLELERQVCIEGEVTKAPRAAVEAYFQTRPRGSRLGAWASPQSEIIPDRTILESRLEEVDRRFVDADVPAPPEWGGYCLAPERIEFWQGRINRLHDRLRYRKQESSWIIERLGP